MAVRGCTCGYLSIYAPAAARHLWAILFFSVIGLWNGEKYKRGIQRRPFRSRSLLSDKGTSSSCFRVQSNQRRLTCTYDCQLKGLSAWNGDRIGLYQNYTTTTQSWRHLTCDANSDYDYNLLVFRRKLLTENSWMRIGLVTRLVNLNPMHKNSGHALFKTMAF